tara:strand:- start:108 stop:269 length:162 start_codon:yes stop_codon:yes gene_type:complete
MHGKKCGCEDKEKMSYTIEKARPKKDKKKVLENMKNNPMFFIFGEGIFNINQN